MTDIIMIITVLIGPIIAVGITLWYSERKEKRKQKMDLFLALLSTRKTHPIPPKFVDSLNLIDVVFNSDKNVISAWKDLYNAYAAKPFQLQNADRKLLDLLDEMAKSLGYKNIKQTDYDAFYQPELFANQRAFQDKLNSEILRVLENSENFGNKSREDRSNEKASFQ